MGERDYYQGKLAYLWDKSRAGALLSNNTIWQELRAKTNLPDLQAELDKMDVKYVR